MPYPGTKRIPAHELAEIVSEYVGWTKAGKSNGEAYLLIAATHERPSDSIRSVIQRLRPTIDPAKVYLKAQALRLAIRVVRNANVQESMEILANPEIGVLQPKTEGPTGQGGFFLSVTAESCGAVKIGLAQVPQANEKRIEGGLGVDSRVRDKEKDAPAEPPAEVSQELHVIDVHPEPIEEYDAKAKRPYQGRFRPSDRAAFTKNHQDAIDAGKRRLLAARKKTLLANLFKGVDPSSPRPDRRHQDDDRV